VGATLLWAAILDSTTPRSDDPSEHVESVMAFFGLLNINRGSFDEVALADEDILNDMPWSELSEHVESVMPLLVSRGNLDIMPLIASAAAILDAILSSTELLFLPQGGNDSAYSSRNNL